MWNRYVGPMQPCVSVQLPCSLIGFASVPPGTIWSSYLYCLAWSGKQDINQEQPVGGRQEYFGSRIGCFRRLQVIPECAVVQQS